MRRLIVLAIIAGCTCVPVANADDSAGPAAKALVETFDAMCVQSVPDLDHVEGLAAAMGLKETTGSDPAVPAAGSHNRFKTWRITGVGGSPLSLSITGGEEGGRAVSVCAVTSLQAEPTSAEQMLKDALQLGRPFRTDTSEGQNYIDWNKKLNGRTIIVSAVDATPSGKPGVNFAATVIERQRR